MSDDGRTSERARALMREMGTHPVADEQWADTSASLTAAGAYVDSQVSRCVQCQQIIAAGEPFHLLSVPGLAAPQRFHKARGCADEFAASKGAPAFARGGAR